MQQSTNIYQRARDSAGITQERAAELIGVSAESIKAYEGDRRIPPDNVVVSMAEIYNTQHLAYQHMRKASEIGRNLIPDVEVGVGLAEAVCEFFDSTPDMDALHKRLIRYAKDGVIDEVERPQYDADMTLLDEHVKAIFALRYHKTHPLKRGADSHG